MNSAPESFYAGEKFGFIAKNLAIFPKVNSLEVNNVINLLCATSKYGLICAANNRTIKVFRNESLYVKENATPLLEIVAAGQVIHLSMCCDSLTLLVIVEIQGSLHAYFYDVRNFVQGASQCPSFCSTPLSSHTNAKLTSVAWNPTQPQCVAVGLSTGHLSLLQLTEKSVQFCTKEIKTSALGWSAKGKQLAVGQPDCTIALFKPDLTPVRTIAAPPLQNCQRILDITWFTNFEFFVSYHCNSNVTELLYVKAPKSEAPAFIDFEDICYSHEDNPKKPVTYYSKYIPEWNVLFTFSSHGTDLGVIGKTADGKSWCQWTVDEEARAELNFVDVTSETFPLGFTLDLSSTKTFQEDATVKGPFPVLVVLSTGGELNVFHCKNLLPQCPKITVTVEPLPTTGIRTAQQYGHNPVVQNLSTSIGSTDSKGKSLQFNSPGMTGTPTTIKSPAASTGFQQPFFSSQVQSPQPFSTVPKSPLFSSSNTGQSPFQSTPQKSLFQAAQPSTSALPVPQTNPVNKSLFQTSISNVSQQSPMTQGTAQPAVQIPQGTPLGQSMVPVPQGTPLGQSSVPVPQSTPLGQPGVPVPQSTVFGQPGVPVPQSTVFGQPGVPVPQSTVFGQPGVPVPQRTVFGQPGVPVPQGTPLNQPGVPVPQGTPLNQPGVPVPQGTPLGQSGIPVPQGTSLGQPVVPVPQGTPLGQPGMGVLQGSPFRPQTVQLPQGSLAGNLKPAIPPQQNQNPLEPSTPVTPVKPPAISAAEKKRRDKIFQEAVNHHIVDEFAKLEQQIQKHKKANVKINEPVGDEKDAAMFAQFKSDTQEWMSEMTSTTKDQSREMSQLHQSTMEEQAMFEDIKNNCQSKKGLRNQTYLQLRPLDPYSRRKLEEIRKKFHYIQTQMGAAQTKLDLDWEKYNAQLTRKKSLCVDTIEAVYRSVINLHNARLTTEENVNELCKRMKDLNPRDFLFVSALPSENDNEIKILKKAFAACKIDIDKEVPKICANPSPSKSVLLQRALSKQTHTPIRTYSTPKKSFDVSQLKIPKDTLKASPIPVLDYDDISPVSSPQKPLNPLQALSSLVGDRVQGNFASSKLLTAPSVPKSFGAASTNIPNVTTNPNSIVRSTSIIASLLEAPPTNTGFASPKMGGSFSFVTDQSPVNLSKPQVTLTSKPQNYGSVENTKSAPNSSESLSKTVSSPFTISAILNSQPKATSAFNSGSSISSAPSGGISFANTSTPILQSNTPVNKSFSFNIPSSAGSNSIGVTSKAGVPQVVGTPFASPTISVSTTSGSIFGQTTDSKPKGLTSSSGIFGGVTATSIVSSATPRSSQELKSSSTGTSAMFGTPISTMVPTSKISVFADANIKPPSTSSTVFETTSKTAFSVGSVISTSGSIVAMTSSTTPSIFSTSSSATSTSSIAFSTSAASSIFGGPKSENTALTSTVPAFSGPTSSISSAFGVPKNDGAAVISISPGFEVSKSEGTAATSSSSAFGVAKSEGTSVTSSSSAFEAQKSESAAVSSVSAFGSSSNSTTSIFGAPASKGVAVTSTGSIFGGSSNSATSIFGAPKSESVSAISTGSAFGVSSGSTTSIFGVPKSGDSAVTSSGSAFGVSSSSIFGVPKSEGSAVTSSVSAFGGSNSSSTSIFATTTTSSIFGGSQSGTGSFGGSSSSIFAQKPGTAFGATSGSLFGSSVSITPVSASGGSAAPQTVSASVSINPVNSNVENKVVSSSSSPFSGSAFAQQKPAFGGGASIGQPSVFGGISTFAATSSSGPFGGGNQSAFGGFSSVANQSSSSPSAVFNKPGNSTSFGQGSSVFGGPSTSVFGNKEQSSSVFGGGTTSGSVFGATSQPSASPFGSNQPSGTSVFGNKGSAFETLSAFSNVSICSGLGGTPSADNSKKNVFGVSATTTPAAKSLFEPSGNNPAFGTPTTSSAFGSGSPFSSNKPSAFGGQATFGGSPVFGGKPVFGSPPAFGGSPGFGAMPGATSGFSAFGGASSPSAFGSKSLFSNQSESASFGNLSQQASKNLSADNVGQGSAFQAWRS